MSQDRHCRSYCHKLKSLILKLIISTHKLSQHSSNFINHHHWKISSVLIHHLKPLQTNNLSVPYKINKTTNILNKVNIFIQILLIHNNFILVEIKLHHLMILLNSQELLIQSLLMVKLLYCFKMDSIPVTQ